VSNLQDAEPSVVRTWNRDGSQDVMGLQAAVENLSRNLAGADGPAEDRRDAVRQALLSGQALQTRHATFKLDSE
jgi:hypothetical protein